MTTSVAQTTQPAKRAALIFVPGISRSWGEHSLRELTDDLMVSLNHLSIGLAFTATAAEPIRYGSGSRPRSAQVITISRSAADDADAKATPVLDLYEMEYFNALAAEQERKPLVWRAVLVFWAFLLGAVRLYEILLPDHGAKPWSQRGQIVLASFVLCLYAILLIALVVQLVEIAVEAVATARSLADTGAAAGASPTTPAQPTPRAATAPDSDPTSLSRVGEVLLAAATAVWDSTVAAVLRTVSLLGVLLWLVLPPRAKLKEAIINSATDYLAVDHYLRTGAGAPRMTGDLVGLLDAVRDDPQRDYRRVDLVSYSLGSILAFNAMFPYGAPPPAGSPVSNIKSLVTIGCPFDTVRLVRPDYFKGRDWLPGVPEVWLNVYMPNDILGSNFSDDGADPQPVARVMRRALGIRDGAKAAARQPPQPKNLAYYPGGSPRGGLVDALLLNGFRVHGQYWDPGEAGEHSCFDIVAEHLYRGDPVLQSE